MCTLNVSFLLQLITFNLIKRWSATINSLRLMVFKITTFHVKLKKTDCKRENGENVYHLNIILDIC